MQSIAGAVAVAVITPAAAPGAAMSAESGQSPNTAIKAPRNQHTGAISIRPSKTAGRGKAQSPIDITGAQYSPHGAA